MSLERVRSTSSYDADRCSHSLPPGILSSLNFLPEGLTRLCESGSEPAQQRILFGAVILLMLIHQRWEAEAFPISRVDTFFLQKAMQLSTLPWRSFRMRMFGPTQPERARWGYPVEGST